MAVTDPSWRAREGVVTAELDGELSLFDGTETALLLNGTASEVWSLLDRPRTVSELVDALVGRYDAPETGIRRDVARLLADLVEHGVVVPG